MRLSASKYPTSSCIAGDGCSCSKAIGIHDGLIEKMRQPHVWMTSAWAGAYHCRIVEGKVVEDWDSWTVLPLFKQTIAVLQS